MDSDQEACMQVSLDEGGDGLDEGQEARMDEQEC